MIEIPKGAEPIILGIASNEKEAELMVKNARKKSRSTRIAVTGYSIPVNTTLTFENFLDPTVYL